MRHLKKGRKLNRKKDHRKAMFNNMLESFFHYERIQTTAAKAKELRSLSEKMITRAKQNTLHNKRIVLKRLHNRDIVAKLFDDIAPRYQDVHGGYTRILKVGRRQGDGAHVSLLELVDIEEAAEQKKKAKALAQKKPVKAPAARSTSEKKAAPVSKAKAAATDKKPEALKKPTTQKTGAKSGGSAKAAPKTEQAKSKASTAKTKTQTVKKQASGAKSEASTVKPKSPAAKKDAAVKPKASTAKASAKKQTQAPKSKSEKPDAKGSA